MRPHVIIPVGALVLATVSAPLWLRATPFFDVRRVDLIGARYLEPDKVLTAAALADDRNLFDPLGDVYRRLQRLPGVADVKIDRQLPATLRIRIHERTPVALVAGPDGFLALDSAARPLPYDLAGKTVDVPVVERADIRLVRTVAAVRSSGGGLFDEVDRVALGAGDVPILVLDSVRVLFHGVPDADGLARVVAARRYLDSQGVAYRELDARFGWWVVVRSG